MLKFIINELDREDLPVQLCIEDGIDNLLKFC